VLNAACNGTVGVIKDVAPTSVVLLVIVLAGVAGWSTAVDCNPMDIEEAVAPGGEPPLSQALKRSKIKRQTIHVFEIAGMYFSIV